MSLEDMFQPRFLMNEAGGDGGDAGGSGGEGGEGGDTGAATQTDDGTGGKAPFGETGGKTEGDGGDGGGDKPLDMKALLGEELAGNQNISKFLESENPVQELAKSLIEAQKQVGKPKVGVPGEQATDEEKTAFWKELGVPDDADGYEFAKPEGMPDEAYDAEDAKAWAEFFKENNFTKEQANAARDRYMELMVQQGEAGTAALNEALDKSFGDKKGAIAKEIGDLMTKAIPDKALRETIQNGLNSEQTPAFALALGHVLQHMKKTYGLSDINTGDGGDGSSGKSIAELRADAQKKMASDAYRDPMHKDHGAVKKEVNDMYKEIGELTNQSQKR